MIRALLAALLAMLLVTGCAAKSEDDDRLPDITLAGFTSAYDGDAALTFDEFRQETSGENALEQVLQDRAETLRQQLNGDAPAPAAGTETPAAPATP